MHCLYSAFSSSSEHDNDNNNRTNNHRRHGTSSMNNHHNGVPSRPVSSTHTLPLPEPKASFKRREHILPSPEDAHKKISEKGRTNHSYSKRPPGIAIQDRSKNTGHKQSSLRYQGFKHGETVHPTTTPVSRQVGVVYHYQTIPQRSMHNSDGSSVHRPYFKFPLHEKLPISRPDRSQATVAIVHPLPLPPGAAGRSPFPSPNTINKRKQTRWKKGKLIGRGTFGSVYVGSDRETGALCAMKEVEMLLDDPISMECINQLKQEIDVLSQLKHPNIVQYYGSEIVEDRFYVYLEYVLPGSINKYAHDHCGGMTESIVRSFTRHIVSGLAYLHSKMTIHRDIKGANLLVDANGVVKLADFGMAKHLDGEVKLSMKGSPYWIAPELLHGEPQKDGSPDLALAVDIWSLGCTIIEMMNGKPPLSEYEAAAAMFKVMKDIPPIPETMSFDGKDFLRSCFIRNPAERPTASMLLEHKFLMVQNLREHSR